MGDMITIQGPDGPFDAYCVGSGPGVVVIQEIFGVNAVMRGVCDDLAEQGFAAACPDLFWRAGPGVQLTDQTEAEWKRAFELYQGFDVDKGVADIRATADALREHKSVSSQSVGAVGFCLGGLLAYLAACHAGVAASVGYYGVGIEKRLGDLGGREGKLMLHIAQNDSFCPPEAQGEIHAALEGLDGVVLHDYPGMEHAFARKGGEHYDETAANLARARTLAFLREGLA